MEQQESLHVEMPVNLVVKKAESAQSGPTFRALLEHFYLMTSPEKEQEPITRKPFERLKR